MTASGIMFSNDTATTEIYTLSLHDALPICTAQDITLGAGNLTLNVTGNVTQTASNVITAAGLQLLGSGTVTLNDIGNNDATPAATYIGPIRYTDCNT